MSLNAPERAIRKSHGRHALAFTPTAATVNPLEQGTNLDAAARGDRFDLFDLANDLELHSERFLTALSSDGKSG